MKTLKRSEDLKPLSAVKTRAGQAVRQVEETWRPVDITRHGRGVVVVMSLETFESLPATEERLELLLAVTAGEDDVAAVRFHSHADVVARVRARLHGLDSDAG